MSKVVEVLTEVALIATLDSSPAMEKVEWNIYNVNNIPSRHSMMLSLPSGEHNICAKLLRGEKWQCTKYNVKEAASNQLVIIELGMKNGY